MCLLLVWQYLKACFDKFPYCYKGKNYLIYVIPAYLRHASSTRWRSGRTMEGMGRSKGTRRWSTCQLSSSTSTLTLWFGFKSLFEFYVRDGANTLAHQVKFHVWGIHVSHRLQHRRLCAKGMQGATILSLGGHTKHVCCCRWHSLPIGWQVTNLKKRTNMRLLFIKILSHTLYNI